MIGVSAIQRGQNRTGITNERHSARVVGNRIRGQLRRPRGSAPAVVDTDPGPAPTTDRGGSLPYRLGQNSGKRNATACGLGSHGVEVLSLGGQSGPSGFRQWWLPYERGMQHASRSIIASYVNISGERPRTRFWRVAPARQPSANAGPTFSGKRRRASRTRPKTFRQRSPTFRANAEGHP